MQEFLKNDKVSCNLMSLTGYRILIILYELIKSPKTLDELNDSLKNNKYVDEKFSDDTLRLYLNSLRKLGCEISKATKKNDFKHNLISHPFKMEISEKEAKAIKNILQKNASLDITTTINIENFIEKLIAATSSEKAIDIFQKLLILKNINRDLLNEFLIHCEKKNQVVFLYNSPKSGKKDIKLICDTLICKNRKIYLTGTNLTHKEYALFPVERISCIKSIELNKSNKDFEPIEVVCKVFSNTYIEENNSELILDKNDDFITVKFSGKNEFELMQRILYLGEKCQVVSPENFRTKIVEKLKQMEAIYGRE